MATATVNVATNLSITEYHTLFRTHAGDQDIPYYFRETARNFHGPSTSDKMLVDLEKMNIPTFLAQQATATFLSSYGMQNSSVFPDSRRWLTLYAHWIIAAICWRSQLEDIALANREMSYQAIANPSASILQKLAEGRRKFLKLRNLVEDSSHAFAPFPVQELDNKYRAQQTDTGVVMKGVAASIAQLTQSFTDNDQYIMGSINIQEAGTMKRLSILAAIYLPLTLATSVFGMNVKEINNSAPKIWAAVVVMVGLLIPTLIYVLYLTLKGRRRRDQEVT